MRVFGLVLSLALGLIVQGCGETKDTTEAVNTSGKTKPALSFENIILTESDQQGQGQLWELKAKKAEYSRDGKLATVTGLEGVFFEQGRKVLLVKADRGQIQPQERVIVLLGNVQARSLPRQTLLTSQQLRWLPDQSLLTATGAVKLTQPSQQLTVTGDLLTGDLAGNTVTLTGKVQAIGTKRNLKLQGTRVLWQVSKNLVQVQAVTVTTLQREQLQAPLVDWNVATQTMSTPQGMTYQRSPNVQLSARRATWEQRPNRITVQGDVAYRQGTTQVLGQNAIADLNQSTVKVTGGVTTRVRAFSR